MSSVTSGSAALANQACQRCYGRKKKCDRKLPKCSSCMQVNIHCSFEEDGQETGLFQVAYVRALEERVRQLEIQLQTSRVPLSQAVVESPVSSEKSPSSRLDVELNERGSPHDKRYQNSGSAQDEIPESLESGLKLLSLEATAERYLGSSSGVTFARLTQAVLKRLKPDLQPFSFQGVSREGPTSSLVDQKEMGSHNHEPSVISGASPQSVPANIMALPSKEHAYRLTEYYWCHSHTLYPFVRKTHFMESLEKMYDDSDSTGLRSSESWLYTMWMVFAIGSTTLSSVMITEETESIAYWNAAMAHFDATLEEGNITALNGILLQVSYSFFNQVGPNTWYLVGIAIRIALGMGLHTKATKHSVQVPKHVQEYRSRLFFSLYMMDRLVSVTLGRPFGIRDDDIEIEPFAAADDANILPDRILPHEGLALPATAVPLHILALRKLAGEIFQEIYSNRNVNLDQQSRDGIIRRLHERLIEWRRNMPFPLPESHVLRVPHLSSTWFDLNYHNHVIMLYRPSPLCPVITVEKVAILADASAMSIKHVSTMHRQQRYAFNWLNLFALFTSTLALIYTITAQPDPISSYLQQSDALADLNLAAQLLLTFGKKFPSALKYHEMVREVIIRLESHVPFPPLRSDIFSLGEDSGYNTPGFGRQDTGWPSGGSHETAYPSLLTGNMEYDNLQQRASNTGSSSLLNPQAVMDNLPLAVQLSHTSGLFDDFAAQDLVSGFDIMGSADLDTEFMSYLESTSPGNAVHNEAQDVN